MQLDLAVKISIILFQDIAVQVINNIIIIIVETKKAYIF